VAIQRWQPWDEFKELDRQMNDIVKNPLSFFRRQMWHVPTEEFVWMPALDLYEKSDKFMVRIEVPGMREEDIDISIAGDVLTIKGERQDKSAVEKENYYRREFNYGNFQRSISLPAPVLVDKAEAHYRDGILEIVLPKANGIKTKKITLKPKQGKPKETQPAKKAGAKEKAAK
jgi:HSP20 family protein